MSRAHAFVALLAAAGAPACQVYDSSLLLAGDDAGVEAGNDACTGSACGGKCVDLSSDPQNCGRCGHACEVGCAQGVCTPTLLAGGLGAPHGILVDGTNLYVANHGGINVQVMSAIDGTGLKNLASSQVYPDRLTSDGNNLYWSNDSDPVGSVNYVALGGGQSYVAARDLPLPYGVVTHGGYLFITTTDTVNNSGGGCPTDAWTSAVLRCPNPGCYVAACATSGGPTVLASQQATPTGITVDATNVYWANSTGGTVMFCPQPDCAGGPQVFAQGLGKPWEVASDGSAVYFTDRSAGKLYACATTGCGGAPGVMATGLDDPLLVTVQGGAVYFTEYAGGVAGKGKVSRCAIPGCTGGPEVLAIGLNAPYAVTADATYVYWSEEGTAGANSLDGKVSKVKK